MASNAKGPQAGRRRWGSGTGVRLLQSLWRKSLRLGLAAGILAQTVGCARPFYRKLADKQVSEILGQKDKYPAWAIENWHVYPDPRARFGDQTNPDFPPKPPDDPAVFDLSPNPQRPGRAGIARVEGTGYLTLLSQWDRENRARVAQQEREEMREEERQEQAALRATEAILTRADDGQVTLHLRPRLEKQKPDPSRLCLKPRWQGIQQVAAVQPAPADQAGPAPPLPYPEQPGKLTEELTSPDVAIAANSRSRIDITGQRAFLISLNQAAELASFNSREYQDQRENLYLAALEVTLERFGFAAQPYVAQQAIRNYAGRGVPGGKRNNWSLNTGVGVAKVLPTSALLLLNFANQTVFDFLNPKKTISVSTLNFDAIQPLLRGGGRAVALEPLTRAERSLLYQIRNFGRFRKQLYVEIASANGGSIFGGSFQPTGVLSTGTSAGSGTGASGLNPGVIPPLSTTLNNPIVALGSAGALAITPAITPSPTGYLSTMLQKIQVYIDQENIAVLTGILKRLRGLLEGNLVGPIQVQQTEQRLLGARATLTTDQVAYLRSVDTFKIELGLPMPMTIEPDNSALRPLINQFRKSRAILEHEQAAFLQASELGTLEKAPQVRASLLRLFERSRLSRGTRFAQTIRGRWQKWRTRTDKDLQDRLTKLRQEGRDLLERETDLERQGQKLPPADAARLLQTQVDFELGSLEWAMRIYERAYVAMGKPKKPATRAEERLRITRFQTILGYWERLMVEPRNEQRALVAATWPEMPRCCISGVDLIQTDLATAQLASVNYALANRWDLMNTRGQVVDAWRQLRVFANALLGVFNVEYHLAANTPLGVAQPLNIGGSRTAHQLILNTQLPLVRVLERNNYRAALIAYQRQRRALQEAEDLAAQVVRSEVWSVRRQYEVYRLQQRVLDYAYLTIDNALEALVAPTAPPLPQGAPAPRTAPDGPAALTTQLLNAQASLPAAQTAVLGAWISYLNSRLQLYRDLELMPLNPRGVWIDNIEQCECPPGPQARPRPGQVPTGQEERWLPSPSPSLSPPR